MPFFNSFPIEFIAALGNKIFHFFFFFNFDTNKSSNFHSISRTKWKRKALGMKLNFRQTTPETIHSTTFTRVSISKGTLRKKKETTCTCFIRVSSFCFAELIIHLANERLICVNPGRFNLDGGSNQFRGTYRASR